MPLLNRNLVKIFQNRIVTASWTRPMVLKSFDLTVAPYWYIEVYDYQSFDPDTWRRAIPDSILKLIQLGHITLLVNNATESFTDVIMPLYVSLIFQLNIKEENIVFCTGGADILATVNTVAELSNKKLIKVILTSEFESSLQVAEQTKPTELPPEPPASTSRKFVNLNRRWRTHRPAFVALLSAHGLLEHGYVSLAEHSDPGYSFTWELCWDQITRFHPDMRSLDKTAIFNSTPLTVDGLDPRINPPWADQKSNWMYRDSYFSIVSETNYYAPETRFLTEKTFKTVLHRHPFILLSRPYTLALFKEKGYQTFHPLINEAYDQELDDDKRMQMVLKETQRLCSLTAGELAEFRAATALICDYNYSILMSKTEFNRPLN